MRKFYKRCFKNNASCYNSPTFFKATKGETVKKSILALGLIMSSFSVYSANTSQNAIDFCRDRVEGNYIQDLLKERESRMAFSNQGGMLNGGVCWWHSRFQRNAAYLTYYRPELPRPDEKEAKKLIKKIRMGNDVVEIPGFKNFFEFSSTFRHLVQDRLEAWQRGDGLLRQSWITGLAGGTNTSAEKLEERMDDLFQEISKGEVVYQKLQLKGIIAHAWLVIDMSKTSDGYEISVIDSNYPLSTNSYRYRRGMTSLHYPYFGSFVPYTHKENEEEKIQRVVAKFCD